LQKISHPRSLTAGQHDCPEIRVIHVSSLIYSSKKLLRLFTGCWQEAYQQRLRVARGITLLIYEEVVTVLYAAQQK
jgi:hypothetical protein